MPSVASKPEDLAAIWRDILQNDKKSWVLFEHGTCVILMEPTGDLAAQATEFLSKWGPVHVATPSADFQCMELDGEPVSGWIVAGQHPDVLNYILPEDAERAGSGDLQVGLLGRSNRDADGNELKVIHVEDNRA
ncbi:hypothetical protein ASPSYDRAFT_36298 [Aspergillus sydowii CBS 593.65]|uniref:Uncharacterized protein n=1 Tax=Aspergillus sydowii CBS 593.65 TaxID=1036612 RepID=A0A1L9T1T7_9EURO|nr:uncharacterized protein ASPSYDRAFT_36298 [Aspergillus sydowii CBS 593.65]OJJ53355.1 hypothetical protein ASPSYDRAFT_36298 [Aspergillus sydowii CBS 593.65]